MTDARIARAYPHLPEALGRVALLGETLAMTRDLAVTRREMADAGHDPDKLAAILARHGVVGEIEQAEQAAARSIAVLLAAVSEPDLQDGRDKGLISAEDYREAVIAKRTLDLSLGRSADQERGRDRA